jgi:subtilisin family serine protease
MKFITFYLFFSLLQFALLAQISPNHYLVNFTDKDNSPYSLKHPEQFLTQRAIDRRIKYKIAYDETDLPVNQNYIDSLKALGLEIINVSKWFNSVSVYTKDTLLIDTLSKISFIKSVGLSKKKVQKVQKDLKEPNTQIKYEQSLDFDSSGYDYYGNGFRQIEMLNAHYLHQAGYRGEGMLVAILDAGFYKVNELAAFDSIRFNNQILGVYDFVDKDTSVYDAATHGMMVLSTIAANIPGEFVGTAPKADFLLLRTEQVASEYIIEEHNWAVAAEYADSLGADIISSSLGYNNFDDTTQSHTYSDMDGNTALISIAADLAAKKGILVVSSAGNEGFSQWKYISAPADADSVLTVGAVTEDENIAFFSSRGPTFDQRIKPDVCAQGMPAIVIAANGMLTASSGTSFSAPILTGAVTCLWQAHPELNNMQIIDAVKQSADRYNQPDTVFGYGIPDFYAAHVYLNSMGQIDENTENILNVFPNPFKNILNIAFYSKNIEIPYNSKLEIFDVKGKKVIDAHVDDVENNYSLTVINNVEKLSKGVYIVRLTAKDVVLQTKVVKL